MSCPVPLAVPSRARRGALRRAAGRAPGPAAGRGAERNVPRRAPRRDAPAGALGGALLCLLVPLLAGCGNRGDLYLEPAFGVDEVDVRLPAVEPAVGPDAAGGRSSTPDDDVNERTLSTDGADPAAEGARAPGEERRGTPPRRGSPDTATAEEGDEGEDESDPDGAAGVGEGR